MFKFRSLQKKLFMSQITTIIIFSLVSGFSFFIYTSSVIQNNVLGTYNNLVKSTSNQLDLFVRDMDNLSRNILFSRVYYDSDMFYYLQNSFNISDVPKPGTDFMSDYFFFNPFDKGAADGKYNIYELLQDRNIANVINSINGPEMKADEIVLFNEEGTFFGAPTSSTVDPQEMLRRIASTAWIDGVIKKNGSKVMLGPHRSEWNDDPELVISLARAFTDTVSRTKFGIIETQQRYSKLESMMKLVAADKADSFYVFDDDRHLIFPASTSADEAVDNRYSLAYLMESAAAKPTDQRHVLNPNTKQYETLLINHSDYTGWTTIFAVGDNMLYGDAHKFRIMFISFLVVILTATIIFSYFISRSVTYPMKLLHRMIKKTDLSNLQNESADSRLETSIIEVSEIYNAFNEVRFRLNKTMNENIEVRSKEAKAHWMALQAQMNPHFLYNTLSVIAATSEENGMEHVSDMCRKLSSMLKYVTKLADYQVSLQLELDYTIDYLKLMKFRYEDHLIYDIDIPSAMSNLVLPKLTLQPLVENCINHGFKSSRPPWKISICGSLEERRWELSVADNGCGLASDRIELIRNKVYGNAGQSTEEPGLGLTSTLIRLKEMFNSFYFKLENNDEGGLTVTFGGSLDEL
ncbi:sensor histidine kinase [Cohnella sp. GCM10012308]|uniref:sensor histidine kinase n=1 Tax=Cohnella sp. GCM10012308 TaxID=3317329 RepID=UPI003612C7A3